MSKITIQLLSSLTAKQSDSKETFDCGQPVLNHYLAVTAAQHEKKHTTRTFCALKDNRIVGFCSLSNAEVDIGALPADTLKRYRLPTNILPVLRLCRLAVDRAYQRQGLGALLLAESLMKVLSLAESSGCIGMMVDAKDASSISYYESFGFHPAPDNAAVLFMSLPEVRALVARHY